MASGLSAGLASGGVSLQCPDRVRVTDALGAYPVYAVCRLGYPFLLVIEASPTARRAAGSLARRASAWAVVAPGPPGLR